MIATTSHLPVLRPFPSSSEHVPNKARSVVQVLTKIEKSRSNASEVDRLKTDVRRLVAGEEYVTGSKMIAYENVGSAIGKSASWVRKFVGDQSGVALQFVDFLNIAHAYAGLCERIEAAARTERLRADELRRIAGEAVDCPDELVAGPQGPDRS